MSKKLIDRLRNAAILATSECAWLMTEAADALEAKAAPVGERDDDRAAIHQLAFELGGTEGGEYLLDLDDLNAVIDAAHQRQQAREVVMPERKELPDLLLATYHENRGWNACLDEFARLNKGAGSHE